MDLGQGVNVQEKGTTADQERRAGVINHVVEIDMMTIIEREAENGIGIVIGTEIVIERGIERESIDIVEAEGR